MRANGIVDLPAFELEGELTPCGDNAFVCSAYAKDRSANCALKQKVFTLPVGEAQTIIALPTGTTSTSAIPVSTTGGSTLITSTRPSSSASPTASGDEDEDEKDKTRIIAIAAGVGGAAALAAGLGLVWFFCIKKRKNRLSSPYSTTDSFSKPAPAMRESFDAAPSIHPDPVEIPGPPPSQPPVAPDTDVYDGRTRYHLYDDGEVEIASGGIGDVPSPAPAVQRPQNDRAHVLRNAPSRLTTSDEEPDVRSIFGRPEAGRVSPLHEGRY